MSLLRAIALTAAAWALSARRDLAGGGDVGERRQAHDSPAGCAVGRTVAAQLRTMQSTASRIEQRLDDLTRPGGGM